MDRRQLIGGGLVAGVAALAGATVFHWRQTGFDTATGGLWTQRFARPGGGELVMASLQGQPLLLNFWGTWCPPCVKEMPELDRFHRAWQARGGQVLGLAVDNERPVQEFLARSPVSYPIALAGFAGAELARRLGNDKGGLPFSVLFDSRGLPWKRKAGETRFDELMAWADQLAAAK